MSRIVLLVIVALTLLLSAGVAVADEYAFFFDPDNCDFRLRPDSPALAMGFVPIDVTSVGPRR